MSTLDHSHFLDLDHVYDLKLKFATNILQILDKHSIEELNNFQVFINQIIYKLENNKKILE